MTPTIFLSDGDVEAALSWPELIAAVRAAYAVAPEPGSLPPRTIARGDGAWLRTLSGAPTHSAHMGVKLIAASPRNRRVTYLMALFDRTTTELVGLIDANRVTATRTAATSAVAAAALAPQAPLHVAVIGSGVEARNHVLALGVVRELASVAVFSPTEANRSRLADLIGAELGVEARAVAGAEEAVAEAELVIGAARSHDESPTIRGSWLRPGATVVSIGSTLPEQHEVDVEVVSRCDLIFADVPEEVASETGDMLDASRAGVGFRDKLHSLHELVAGAVPGRRRDRDIVLYKSVGSALQDLAVAELCLERARELGLGTPIPATAVPVHK
jgi:ornithine cyclodeaminase/alanine dehydrogenase